MALVGTPHTAKLSLLFTYGTDGQQCMNTFYEFDATDAIFVSPANTAAVVQAAATAHIVPALFPEVSTVGVLFEDVRTVPFGGAAFPHAAVAGTRAGGTADLPSSVCLAIKKVTGNLGRSGRGRWFWPLGDVQAISGSNDTVGAAYITAIEAGLTAFQAAIEGSALPCQVGIVSYQHNNVARSAGLFQQITAWSNSDATIDSQRRRLTGRGR